MESAHVRWVVANAIIVTAAINVVLNGGPAWLASRDLDSIPLWTVPLDGTGIFTDTLGTMLILPFVTTLLCTTAVRHELRTGRLPRLERFPRRIAAFEALPDGRAVRGLVLAFATLFALAAPAAGVLALAAPDGMSADGFVAYKTALGVGLGLLVTPLIAVRAMSDVVE